MRVRLVFLSGFLFLVALIGAGCGDYTELEFREPVGTIEVDLVGPRTLEPSEITLDRPGTYAVRVENVADSHSTHALEIASVEGSKINYKEGSVRSPDLSPGTTAPEFKVHLEPGTYELYCPVGDHRAQGMRGTLTVKEG